MAKRRNECGDLPPEKRAPLKASFTDLMEVRNPATIATAILDKVGRRKGFEQARRAIAMLTDAYDSVHAPDRKEGKPALIHPLRVTWRLMQYRHLTAKPLTPTDFYIALFHDALEDTRLSPRRITELVGSDVHDGVALLTKKYQRRGGISRDTGEYFTDIWNGPDNIQEIKLIDRIDNMSSLFVDMPREFVIDQVVETRAYVEQHATRFPRLCHDLGVQLNRFEQIVPRKTRKSRRHVA